MKIVSSKQMSQIESQAYRQGASESDFMEEAGSGVSLVVHDYAEDYDLDKYVILLCGKGNNAGDAYVAGSQLLLLEYHVVAYQTFPIKDCTPLCRENHLRFVQDGGTVKEISSAEEIVYPPSGIIIDGLFGTGYHGEVQEPIASIIDSANKSRLPIVAVDIPSGLDGESGTASKSTIIATQTAFLGLPKAGFFLRDGWNHVGKLEYVDFGLPKEFIAEVPADFVMLSPDVLKPLLPPLTRNRHKYQAGYVVGLAGSRLMPGAAMLAAQSSLSSGAGIVRLLYPEEMEPQLSGAPYEMLRMPYKAADIDLILETMSKANALFIGPGLGLTPEIRKLVRQVFAAIQKPCVIDADALTIIAEDKIPIPKNAILTPHAGELKRLMQIEKVELTMEFLKQCRAYADRQNVTLVLKGGPSFIFHNGEPILVSPRGDPGMATAGSGDVLTGHLAALLAQGLSPKDAAALGVYLHGVAGEFAAQDLTSYCVVASDIINYLPDAFRPDNW